jgi:hypothetical protein
MRFWQLNLDVGLTLDPLASHRASRRLVRLIAGNPVTIGETWAAALQSALPGPWPGAIGPSRSLRRIVRQSLDDYLAELPWEVVATPLLHVDLDVGTDRRTNQALFGRVRRSSAAFGAPSSARATV